MSDSPACGRCSPVAHGFVSLACRKSVYAEKSYIIAVSAPQGMTCVYEIGRISLASSCSSPRLCATATRSRRHRQFSSRPHRALGLSSRRRHGLGAARVRRFLMDRHGPDAAARLALTPSSAPAVMFPDGRRRDFPASPATLGTGCGSMCRISPPPGAPSPLAIKMPDKLRRCLPDFCRMGNSLASSAASRPRSRNVLSITAPRLSPSCPSPQPGRWSSPSGCLWETSTLFESTGCRRPPRRPRCSAAAASIDAMLRTWIGDDEERGDTHLCSCHSPVSRGDPAGGHSLPARPHANRPMSGWHLPVPDLLAVGA